VPVFHGLSDGCVQLFDVIPPRRGRCHATNTGSAAQTFYAVVFEKLSKFGQASLLPPMGCGRIDAELSRCLPTRQLHELQLRADEVTE
jgi:hypothetical protein